MNIRPVSDLRTKLKDIEQELNSGSVFLTKNGYGSFVIMSIDDYERSEHANNYYNVNPCSDAMPNSISNGEIDVKLLEAQKQANEKSERLTHEQVFSSIRNELSVKASHAV